MSHQRTHDSNAEIVETLRTTAGKEDVEVKLHLENGETISGNCNNVRHYSPLEAESKKHPPGSGSASFNVEINLDDIPTEHEINVGGYHYIIIETEEIHTTGEWRDPDAWWYVDVEDGEEITGSSPIDEIGVLNSD